MNGGRPLLFFYQKQLYSPSNCFSTCCIICFAIDVELLCCFIVKTHFYIISFWVLCFWSPCAWRHFITSLFEFHKSIIIIGAQKVKGFFITKKPPYFVGRLFCPFCCHQGIVNSLLFPFAMAVYATPSFVASKTTGEPLFTIETLKDTSLPSALSTASLADA